MPLRIVRRKQTNTLTISGTIRLGSGARIRIQQRARSNDPKLAEEEARVLEAEVLRTDWHGGERRSAKSFAAAVLAYFEAKPRTDATKKRYNRVLRALGDVPLSSIDQDTVTKLRDKMMRPATTLRPWRERSSIHRAP
jgi:hypothetical protein